MHVRFGLYLILSREQLIKAPPTVSANISIAKICKTEKYVHINDVHREVETDFICNCGSKLTAVKSEARKKDWHFRHYSNSDIAKCRSTALHDYAVQIICEHAEIIITEKIKINYEVNGKEVWLNDLYRSDVAVNYENEVAHFEVFVTHDLSAEKTKFYQDCKIKCVKIDLSNKELLMASPEKIKDGVLNQFYNKELIFWEKPERKDNIFGYIIIAILSFIGLRWLYKSVRK